MTNRLSFQNVISWIFGIAIFVDGLLNLFRGNDFSFGIFLIILSFIYFPPANTLIKKRFNFTIPVLAKILLAIFIIWVTLAVGAIAEGYYPELF
ncbi:MAG: hypothetical protein ACOCRK_01820 [bacterium]